MAKSVGWSFAGSSYALEAQYAGAGQCKGTRAETGRWCSRSNDLTFQIPHCHHPSIIYIRKMSTDSEKAPNSANIGHLRPQRIEASSCPLVLPAFNHTSFPFLSACVISLFTCSPAHLSSSVHHKTSSLPFMTTGKSWFFPCLIEFDLVVIVCTFFNWRTKRHHGVSTG